MVISQLNNSDTGLIRPRERSVTAQIGPSKEAAGSERSATCPAGRSTTAESNAGVCRKFAMTHAEGAVAATINSTTARIGHFAGQPDESTWIRESKRGNRRQRQGHAPEPGGSTAMDCYWIK